MVVDFDLCGLSVYDADKGDLMTSPPQKKKRRRKKLQKIGESTTL